jgi:ribonucleoside-triphosphate reductase
MIVIKRDGRKANFSADKMKLAIYRAMERTESGVDSKIASSIVQKFQDRNKASQETSVEEIQDFIENELMKSKCKDAAKEYIKNRHDRDIAREAKTKDIFMSIVNTVNNDVTRENANMNSDSPAGMMMKFASETTKPFVDNYLLSEEVREAVKKNYLHIHDKDYYPTKSLTCLQHPLDKVLETGFKAGHGEARGAKRIETASILAAISMETVQNEQHGGQGIPAFDFYMAPYVRLTYIEELKSAFDLIGLELTDEIKNEKLKDYLKKDLSGITDPVERAKQAAMNETVSRVHQSMESFIHNMNSIHSRGGNQVVFSSINYATDTSAEGRCVIRELLLSTERGVGNGATAIFPIQIWKLKKGVSYLPGDPNYDLYQLACRVSARRFFPNFLNLDATFNQEPSWDPNDPKRYEHEVATMGCRTRVFDNRFGPRTSVGRGNLSFTTINFVKLAIETSIEDGYIYFDPRDKEYKFDYTKETPELIEDRIKRFKEKLSNVTALAAKQLDDRYQFQKTALKKQFPLLMSGLWLGSEKLGPNDQLGDVINQGTLGIGFIGLAEALVAMTGKHHGESEKCQEYGLGIIKQMFEDSKKYSEKYQHNYSVLATPAEGLSGKFTKVDQKTYGKIPGVTEFMFYTNSNHVPVYYNCSAIHKAEVEGPYHCMTLGGHIFYVELDGDATKNPESIMDVVDMAVKNNIGYLSVNHFQTRCPNCNYESNDDNGETVCPHCGTELTILQRITGYLVGTTDRWNAGKLDELKHRVQHGL